MGGGISPNPKGSIAHETQSDDIWGQPAKSLLGGGVNPNDAQVFIDFKKRILTNIKDVAQGWFPSCREDWRGTRQDNPKTSEG